MIDFVLTPDDDSLPDLPYDEIIEDPSDLFKAASQHKILLLNNRLVGTAIARHHGWPYAEGISQFEIQDAHHIHAQQHLPWVIRHLVGTAPAVLVTNRAPQMPLDDLAHLESTTPQPPDTQLQLDPIEAANWLVAQGLFDGHTRGFAVSATQADTTPTPLPRARVIVAGGKGLAYNPAPTPADADDPFTWRVQHGYASLLQPLAAQIGAQLAASRAIIDGAGLPAAYQVGQSGKRVMPAFYIAVGISGTVQHLQGIAPGSRIVAINSDPDARIFQFAHVGIVGDLYTVVPQLLEALRNAKE